MPSLNQNLCFCNPNTELFLRWAALGDACTIVAVLFYTRKVVHRLNPAAREGLAIGVILFDKDRRPLGAFTRRDFDGTELLSSKDDLEVVRALLAELREAAKKPRRLEQYIQETLEAGSLSLVLEPADPLEARDAVEAQETVAARF